MRWAVSWKTCRLSFQFSYDGMAGSLHPGFSGGIGVFYVSVSRGGDKAVEEF